MMVPCFAGEEIASQIPGAQLTVLDAGHGLMLERMDAFNERLSRFLREIDPSEP
jgi:pimeloyl-ACP methyl ester carboxylesterase